jgi:4-hydroxy-4-methyl-2-oxoglutarate aldolase
MTPSVPPDVVTRLTRLDVCCLSDAMDALGLPSGVVDGLRPVWEGAKLTGRAVTARLALGPPPPGTPPVHLGARAIEAAGAGDVIVIDNGGREAMGSWGGLLSSAAALRNVAGVVTDGCCRDVDEARELGFAVFARAGAVRTARGRVHEESCGTPVSLGGVTVNPGDVVAADGSGVVVIPAGRAGAVAERAGQIAHREAGMLASLRGGTPVSEVLGASYEHLLRS